MQPYFFPYLGYWQLLNFVDRFIIYDDVNFIKRGWVNRNRILINGKPSYITIPLHQASQNKLIYDLFIQSSSAWQAKMIKSIENTYRKAPFFPDVFPLIKHIIGYKTDNLANFLIYQLKTIAAFLGIRTELINSNQRYKNLKSAGQNRIIDICKHENTNIYVNLQGGQTLYNPAAFREQNIELYFIVMQQISYTQRSAGFTANLSIVDALMEIGPQGVARQLNKFSLLTD